MAIKRLKLIDEDGRLILEPEGPHLDAILRAGDAKTGHLVEVLIPQDQRSRLAHQLMGASKDEMVMLRRRR